VSVNIKEGSERPNRLLLGRVALFYLLPNKTKGMTPIIIDLCDGSRIKVINKVSSLFACLINHTQKYNIELVTHSRTKSKQDFDPGVSNEVNWHDGIKIDGLFNNLNYMLCEMK